jgi:hypothetical protein
MGNRRQVLIDEEERRGKSYHTFIPNSIQHNNEHNYNYSYNKNDNGSVRANGSKIELDK